MKIALVYTGLSTIGWNSYNRFGRNMDDCYVIPQGLAYLRAVIQKDGRHEADIIDFRMLSGPHEFRKRLVEGKYDVAGFSCLTPSRDYAVLGAEIAKDLGLITIVGGVHASAMPEDFSNTGQFDCVVVGEGEHAIFEILDLIEDGKKLPPVYRAVNYVANLDDLPFPATAFLPTYEHAFDVNDRMAGVTASRGCPGRCRYCWPNQRIMYGSGKIRMRSAGNVLAEMRYLREHFRINLITFYDDTFVWNKAWLREFLDRHRQATRDGVDLPPIAVNARANFFDEEVAAILKEINCIGVWFGFESGSPHVLKLIRKGCTLEQNVAAARICREAGFDVNANMLVGVPGETDEDYLLSYKFLNRIRPDRVRYNVLSPYPGSEFYEELAPKGLIDAASFAEFDVAKPHLTGKGIIKNVDYGLVMKWIGPFRSFSHSGLTEEITALREEIAALRASKSWRITEPLRAAQSFIARYSRPSKGNGL